MKNILGVIMVCMALSAGSAQQQSPTVSSLIETEKAFAAMSAADGVKKAFLTYLADDGILFRPGPVNGKEVWTKAEATTAKLEWFPTLTHVASSGDLGYSGGPWMYTPSAELDQPPHYGFFSSIWKRNNDGEWKVVLDIGVTTGIPVTDTTLVVAPDYSPGKLYSAKKEKSCVLRAERGFSKLATKSLRRAFAKFVASDARIYREGILPADGRAAILAVVAAEPNRSDATVHFSDLAASRDFAYTYGEHSSASSGYFFRIWRKQKGSWKLYLEVLSPAAR